MTTTAELQEWLNDLKRDVPDEPNRKGNGIRIGTYDAGEDGYEYQQCQSLFH